MRKLLLFADNVGDIRAVVFFNMEKEFSIAIPVC